MATNIKPLHDRVIVRRIEEGNRSAAELSFPIPRKKSPRKVGRGSGDGKYRKMVQDTPRRYKGDRVLLANTAVPRSRWMAKSS